MVSILKKIIKDIEGEVLKHEAIINKGTQPEDEEAIGIHIGGLVTALNIIKKNLDYYKV